MIQPDETNQGAGQKENNERRIPADGQAIRYHRFTLRCHDNIRSPNLVLRGNELHEFRASWLQKRNKQPAQSPISTYV